MAYVELTPQEIDYIGRVVETEIPPSLRSINPMEYSRMVGAVVDTITNRMATGRYGRTIEDVLNQPRAFSKITGPSKLSPYGSVANAPKASRATQQAVNEHISQRAAGKPSKIGGAVNYANPHHSDKSNLLGWINPMISAGAHKFGVGKSVHYHGNAPGSKPAGYYEVAKPFGFMPPVVPGQQLWSDEIPVPTARPVHSPAKGARAASELQTYSPFAAPVGPVERAPLAPPSVPSPAMGARAASELQGYVAPAPAPAPAQAVTPPAVTQAPALNAPRSIMDRPVAAPPVPSIVNPSTAMSRPSMPSAVPPTSVTTSSVPLASIGSFPDAPMDPGRKARTEALRGGLAGLATGGLPGAILGAVLGPAKAQIGRNIAARQNPFSNLFSGYRGMFGGLSGTAAPTATPYSVGSGYGAIGSVFGAPAGATALSRSNPEVSFTSLGNGYVSRSNSQYGTSYTMGPGEYDAGMFGGGKSGGKGGKK